MPEVKEQTLKLLEKPEPCPFDDEPCSDRECRGCSVQIEAAGRIARLDELQLNYGTIDF